MTQRINVDIPYLDHGGKGEYLHFLHANGYPPACYAGLLACLRAQYHVTGMLLRPLWPGATPEDLEDWLPLSDDLAAFLEQQKAGAIIGVGHSIGAIVTLRLAIRQPERFRAIILLEPVLFPPAFILFWTLMRWLRIGYRVHPLISSALKRRRTFDDLETVFRGYRRRKVFRYFTDQALRDMITGLTRPRSEGGYELVYSPEWEARIYDNGVWRDMDLWRGLPSLRVPTLIIRGEETDTFLQRTARRVERIAPQTRVETLPAATHLVPLERPNEVFESMQSFLKEIQ